MNNMTFPEADKHYILSMLAYGASDFVKREYGEEAAREFDGLWSAGLTKDEWKNMMNTDKTITAVFVRRRFELNRMMYEQETIDEIYEERGVPPIVDFSHIPAKTLQLGLLLAWRETAIRKRDDESPEKFERRKDIHDYLFGHVNQEALETPLIDFATVDEESKRQREKLQNYIHIIGSKWEGKSGATPGTG